MSEDDDKKTAKKPPATMGLQGNAKQHARELAYILGAEKKEKMDGNFFESDAERRSYETNIEAYIDRKIDNLPDNYWDFSDRTRKSLKLFRVATAWDFETFKTMVADRDIPLDYVVMPLKYTILHLISGYGSIRMYEELLKREDELNFLARDYMGRLASEWAADHADRNNLSELLMAKELEAMEAKRDPKIVKFTPRLTVFEDGTTDPEAPFEEPETAPYPDPFF